MTYHRPILAGLLIAGMALPASAGTLRWARAGDALTLDPHAQNEGPTHALNHQIMEPLIIRDPTGELTPTLATSWYTSPDDPNTWVFELREGVTFHDGAVFTSEDVVFSLNRAMTEASGMKELLASVVEVRAPDDHTVEIETHGPNPILPSNLTNLFIIDEGWAEANGATGVQDYEGSEDTYAAKNANGTGPYKLISREPDVRTVLEINEGYWGSDEYAMEVTRIEYTPIQNAATRVAALLSGEVDFIQDVPVQDLGRVAESEGLQVGTAPQNRTIFFGLNMGADDLATDDVDGANPFTDVRVRKAMNLAINRDAIRQVVMRDQSIPAGIIAPPFVNGWTLELDDVSTDLDQARALLDEAGYGDGFTTTLQCPNDRYVNDEAICQAAVGMLAQVGITVNLEAMPKSQFFPLIEKAQTDFFLLGWGVPTYDSEYIFDFLIHTRGGNYGTWNATGYSNPDLDAQIEALASETDREARDAAIGEIWRVVQDETIYLPVHHQVLNWGMTSAVDAPVDPEDSPKIKMFRLN